MIVFVNSVRESVRITPVLDGAALGVGGGDLKVGVCREGFKPVTATVKSGSEFATELKPFASEVWFLLPGDSKGVLGGLFGGGEEKEFEARLEKTGAVLERMSKFTAGDYPEFKDTARRPFGSWLTYKEQAGLFGVSVEAKNERFWQVQTDGLIYFGVVDLGEKGSKRKLEAELAVHPSFAGNRVEFFADAPDGLKGTLVARLDNLESTGGFDKYGTFSAKVSDNVGGPRKLFVRFGGTACCNMKKCGVFKAE